jgi:hypothetical protein
MKMFGQLFSGVRSKAGRFDASQDEGNGTLDVAVLQTKVWSTYIHTYAVHT